MTLPGYEDPAPATSGDAAEQNPPTRPIERPARLPTKRDFEQALRGKYEIKESEVNLVDGPHGARGSFSLSGNLTPESARATDLAERGPRALAEAFIAAEAETLGLARVDDLREVSLQTKEPSGSSVVIYHRYVGDLLLEGATLIAAIDASGQLFLVSGHLVPLPPELFDAAAQPTLTEADARAIAAAEQARGGNDPNLPMTLSKFAVSEPPYAVWRVRTEPWVYRIDAFTGAIVSKEWGVRDLK